MPPGFAKVFKAGGVTVVLSTLLAACVVVEDGPPPRPGPGPRPMPVMCTQQYDPVCAQRGPQRQTFSNACMADAAGFRLVRPGTCEGPGMRPPGGRPPGGWGPGGRPPGGWEPGRPPGPPPQETRFCTREYAPVCGRQGPVTRTFGNACEADAANFRVLYPGQCR